MNFKSQNKKSIICALMIGRAGSSQGFPGKNINKVLAQLSL